ncbi:hypothetical protein ACBY01_04430 [Sphingomonas sp. ac-8]|uniref:hypothetical protein n=1 Tax=Sphingomonas sp. ac-8 TaxID=3242977 RepID=UPI003A8093AC
MSHDQKPARMRVVNSGGAAPTPQRRRGDVAPTGAAPAPQVGSGPAAAGAARSGKTTALLAALFLVGCIAGGVALPLLGIL